MERKLHQKFDDCSNLNSINYEVWEMLFLVKSYTKAMNNYTYNTSDNVFSDDKSGLKIAKVY